jgi:hypothetical protein
MNSAECQKVWEKVIKTCFSMPARNKIKEFEKETKIIVITSIKNTRKT